MGLPNTLTIIRLIISPVLLYFLVSKGIYISILLYSLGLITDFLDGFVARKLNITSPFGQAMDSVADKVLVFSAMLGLIYNSSVPYIFLFLYIYREFIMLGLRAIKTKNQFSIAKINDTLGRFRFAIMHLGIIILLLQNFHNQNNIGLVLLISSITISYFVLFHHLIKSYPHIKDSMKP